MAVKEASWRLEQTLRSVVIAEPRCRAKPIIGESHGNIKQLGGYPKTAESLPWIRFAPVAPHDADPGAAGVTRRRLTLQPQRGLPECCCGLVRATHRSPPKGPMLIAKLNQYRNRPGVGAN